MTALRPTALLLLLLGALPAVGAAPPGAWWDNRWLERQQLTVDSGGLAIPAGYSVKVTLNHQALAAALRSVANGEDVRIVRWTGTGWLELDRVLDPGSAWNRPTTAFWFRLPVALTGSDDNTYLTFNAPIGGGAPQDPRAVFLHYDDFESDAGLVHWGQSGPSRFIQSYGIAHRGAGALSYPMAFNGRDILTAFPPLNVSDVMVEAWWRMADPLNVDIGQDVRLDPAGPQCIEADKVAAQAWSIWVEVTNPGVIVEPGHGSPAANVWTRISLGVYGSQVRLFQDGVQISPLSGSIDAGTSVVTGNVGFTRYITGGGVTNWWADDFIARRWVDPEPSLTIGPVEPIPSMDGGASNDAGSSDSGTLTDAGVGPRFSSTPVTALICAEAWSYQPSVTGATAPAFRLQGSGRAVVPTGLTVDQATGALHWTPAREQSGAHLLDLFVDAAEGSASQPVDLMVSCSPAPITVGCGCSGVSFGPLILGALGLLLGGRRLTARPRTRE